MPRLAPVAALAAALLSAGCSVFGGRSAPEPAYDTVISEPPFEIRAYPALTVARTAAGGDRDAAVRIGFSRLFDYISGANAPAEDIAMTAPVITEPEGEGAEIAMTAPVLTEEGGRALAGDVRPARRDERRDRPAPPPTRRWKSPPSRRAGSRWSPSPAFSTPGTSHGTGRV